MDKEDFNIITTKLEERIKACDETLGLITEDNPIENITVAQLKAIKSFAAKEYKKQSNILLIDCYHVIGMGNLSATQLGIFTKLIKQYSEYRPDLNAVMRWDGNIDNLPKIPKRTKFKLLELGITLVNGRSGEIEEISEDNIIEQQETIDKNELLENSEGSTIKAVGKFKVSLNSVILEPDEVEEFSKFVTTNISQYKTIDPNIISNKILTRQAFAGLDWAFIDNQYRGIPKNQSIRNLFKNFYTQLDSIMY